MRFTQSGTVLQVIDLPISGDGQGRTEVRHVLQILKEIGRDCSAVLEGQSVSFESGGRSKRLELDLKELPEPTAWESHWLPTKGFGGFLARALPFTEESASRYALNSILLEEGGELVATNGKYLAVFNSPARLPSATVRILGCPFFQAREIEGLEAMSVHRQEIAFRGPNWSFVLREDPRPFPTWRDVLPKGDNTCVELQPELLATLRSECQARQEHTVFDCDGTVLRMSSKDFSTVEVACASEQPWKIQLDPKLLRVVLREPIRQWKIYNKDQPLLCTGEGVRILLMPVSLD